MADVKPGLYAFSRPGVHYVGGRARTGTMVVTDALAQDPYVERLVDARQLKYAGPAPTEAPSGPKLINRAVPAPEPTPIPPSPPKQIEGGKPEIKKSK